MQIAKRRHAPKSVGYEAYLVPITLSFQFQTLVPRQCDRQYALKILYTMLKLH
jgi:hypothetical protein